MLIRRIIYEDQMYDGPHITQATIIDDVGRVWDYSTEEGLTCDGVDMDYSSGRLAEIIFRIIKKGGSNTIITCTN